MPRATFHAAFRSRLFLATTLPALDGTLAAVAARGGLATTQGAVATGLAVIAGVGAWSSARREFPRRGASAVLAVILTASTLGAVLAAWGGERLGTWWPWFPTAAGVVVVLLALHDLRRALAWTR